MLEWWQLKFALLKFLNNMNNKKWNECMFVIQKVVREEIQNFQKSQPNWMRSSQVREMLSISDSTLQTLRINGTIPAYKLGATWVYKQDEIIAVLEANRIGRKETEHV